MSGLEVRWIESSYLLFTFVIILFNMFDFYLIKNNSYYFFINVNLYSYLFNILKYSIIKIYTIIDVVATHYIDKFNDAFEFLYVNINYKSNLRYFFQLLINKENLIVSISNLFKSVAWLEREIWDLFGLKFIYHKDLRRILTDYGFLGHPLLKQFPVIGFIELRYDDSIFNIIKEAIEMSQLFRLFFFMNPWIIWK